MIRRFGLLFAILLFPLFAIAQENPRLLVRGQEIVLSDWVVKNNHPYLNVQEKSLSRIVELLGCSLIYDGNARRFLITRPENHAVMLSVDGMTVDAKGVAFDFPVMFSERADKNNMNTFVSLQALAKACDSNLSFDADKNILYLDPFLTGVSVNIQDKEVDLTVDASGPIQPGFTHILNPDRLVVDFPFTVLSPLAQTPSLSPNAIVQAMRLAQFQAKPNGVRLVLNLAASNLQWTTQGNPESGRFTLAVSPQAEAHFAIPPPPAPASPAPPQGPSQLTGLAVKSEKSGPANEEVLRVDLKLSAAAPYEWHRMNDFKARYFIDLKNCKPEIQKGPVYQTSLVSDIRVGEFQKDPPITRIVFDLTGNPSIQTESTPDGLQITIAAHPPDASEALSGEGETGGVALAGAPVDDGKSKTKKPAHPNGLVIALDPGHGGSDPGAHGRSVVEKEATLDIAFRLRDLLTDDGFTVAMTRTSDVDVLGYHGGAREELQARVDVAERARAAIFISIHLNSSETSWPHGIETHWYKAMDLPLADVLQKHLANEAGFEDRGILRNRYYVLRSASMPSVLVELGFLSNPGDEAKLEQPDIRQKLAEALRDGIEDFAHVSPKTH